MSEQTPQLNLINLFPGSKHLRCGQDDMIIDYI